MKILGRYDRVDLPQLGVFDIHAKIDTGAYTSSLHCSRAQVVDGVLEFVLLDQEHTEFTGLKFYFSEFEERDIKNSFGEVERRFVITTSLRIFNEEITTEFSLCNRGSLRFPVLIGRKIMKNRFLIDVTKKNLSFRQKNSIAKQPVRKASTKKKSH
ncbi:MAG: RimK/LysX family protein [Chryseolinea sp.]